MLLATRLRCPRLGHSRIRNMTSLIKYSEEVSQAKADNRPIVALESTIIAHGMPYPQNLETARQVEHIIREQGATPATVAIMGGELRVGLNSVQLERLAQGTAVKTSRRDLAAVLAAGIDGATTVSGTIVAAKLASIPIFVTGGIGGVHRDGETSLDISADLTELGRSSTLVVSSGVKSILDIGRTLEYLETQGVCVAVLGATHEFPAFYTRNSGHRAPHSLTSPRQAAKLLQAHTDLALNSGVLIAVPVPEDYAMDAEVIEEAINKALLEAKSRGIKGKEVTPFVLAAVAKVTDGASLSTNVALIKNNAKVGAQIAVEYKKLGETCTRLSHSYENSASSHSNSRTSIPNTEHKGSRGLHTCSSLQQEESSNVEERETFSRPGIGPVVIGGSNVDRTFRITEDSVKVIEQIIKSRVSMQRESSDYYWSSKYDVMEISG